MNGATPIESREPVAGLIKLKITEAMTKDTGHAYARINPEDLLRLKAAIGDTVEISGKRKTVCKLMPVHSESRGKSSVQMDGVSRESAGAGLGEIVTLRKVTCRIADQVTLAPTNVRPSERDLDYIGSLLDGLPVLEGNRSGDPVWQPLGRFQSRGHGAQGTGPDRAYYPADYRRAVLQDRRCVRSLTKISADSSRNCTHPGND